MRWDWVETTEAQLHCENTLALTCRNGGQPNVVFQSAGTPTYSTAAEPNIVHLSNACYRVSNRGYSGPHVSSPDSGADLCTSRWAYRNFQRERLKTSYFCP